MNYGGNMPDWHQYNSSQPIGSEVPPVGQNANHSPIFGSNISPRRLNGPTYSPEGLNKHQNDANFNPRNFQQSPNTLTGPNVPPENSPMGSTVQMSGCHGPYGAPSPRNLMIESTGGSLDSRNVPGSSLNEAIGQRNHQMSLSRPAAHLNCSNTNGSMGTIGQRSTPTNIQGPLPPGSRQGPGSYIPCKLPCCNPDSNISYPSWEKFGPYPPNVPYRDTSYPVDNRRFGNDFENREQLGSGAYNIDPRRNFPDYKYRKDSTIIPRTYAHPPSVIQNYPIQNYNFPADYQKYPPYPVKEYPRDSSIANPQNPAILKYQEQSVIVQQKYFTKQIQYQNGVVPKSIVPTSMGSNVISRTQNPYYNPQAARDFPRSYSESTPLTNRGIQSTNPIHAAYPRYQMYQQKIAMQRFSMENHLQELTRIPGYQTHPKYQESILRYRELLRLQHSVDYQSTAQNPPKAVTSQINDEIPPINLQFDQNGVLINSSFVPTGFSNLQSPINLQSSKNVQSVSNAEVGPLNLQYSEQFKPEANIDNRVRDQDLSSLSKTELSHKNEEQFSIGKNQLHVQKYESESLNVPNSEDGKASSMHQRNSRDFADKPELDVRQFLANWDESEDEDGTNANVPDVASSNSTSGVEYHNTKAVTENPEESGHCSGTKDCRGRDDCGMFENNRNEMKPSNSTNNQIYQCNLPPSDKSTKSRQQDLDISDSGKRPVRTGTVIQPTSTECENEITLDMMENLGNDRAAHGSVRLLHRETESLNHNKRQELTDTIKDDIIIKKESPIEEQTSSKNHIEAYRHEADTEICSSIEEIMKNNDDSRSSTGEESSDNTKHHFGSNEDLSESDETNSMDSHSISSFIKSPKTIKGTEIHVDAQELSAIPIQPKSNSELLDNTNLQKQNSVASEESHNPDDISLPDLLTSECTPISTTLNTPIHSDSEESSEPVIDLTTPANPIEIIQNSPMLSFTHSPIKMEPYEHLDENDLTDKVSHRTLDFEFQANNSCDNDYEKLTDVSSHTTEQYNVAQNEEDTFDSDCIEILSEKVEQKIEGNIHDLKSRNDVIDNITDQNRFAFNEEIVMATDNANTTFNADHQPWPSATVRQRKHQISNNTEHRDAKIEVDKLEALSEMKDRLSVMSGGNKDHLKDDLVHVTSATNYQGTNRWSTKCDMENVKFESTDNMTALNLVKDENKVKSDSIKVTDGTAFSEVIPKSSRSFLSNSNEGEDFKHSNQNQSDSSMENEVIFTSTEHTVGYSPSSEKNKIYKESIENQSNFTGSLNIPLIPGEDFEEPKMPVLPMEGNCLTKIIKNTSPITDLDVLGSDDEKLDKMDEIWMEVGGVETVGKITDVNADTYTECGDGPDREKSLSSRKKLRMLQKNDWKSLKNSAKAKDPSKIFGKVYDSQERDLNLNSTEKNSRLHKSSSSETARKEPNTEVPVNEYSQSAIISETDSTTAILQEKHNVIKVPTISKITRDSFCSEDGKQNHDICLENNVTEILKCQEKANHINDIATKLLENARLFEPELRKIAIQRKESGSSDNTRDGSKKRIKLLKEFRKVKNKMNIETSGIQSIKPMGAAENNVVPLMESTEQYKKVDAETMKENNKIMKNQNALISTVETVLQNSDPSIMNSIATLDSQVIKKTNLNADENTINAISTNIAMPDEKPKQIFNEGKAIIRNEDTPRESCTTVNIEESITVEDRNGVNSRNSYDTKVVSPIKEDINDCAINLSKSTNHFDLLQTLSENGCVTNNSHNSYTSEHVKIEEPTEIEGKINDKTTDTVTKDDSPILSPPSCPEESGLSSEIVEVDDKTPEIHDVEPQNLTEGNREFSSAHTCTNSAEQPILKEDTKLDIDQESIRTVEHEEPAGFPDNLEDVGDLDKSCRYPEKMVDSMHENCENSTNISELNDAKINTFVSTQSGHLKSNELVAVNEKEDQMPTNTPVDSEVTCNAENVQNDIGETSAVYQKETIQSIDSFADSEKKRLSSNSPEERISIESLENCVQNIDNIPEEKVVESVKNCIETISVSYQEKDIDKLSVVQQVMESEPMIDIDCTISIQKSLQNVDVLTDIHIESKTLHNDLEFVEKPSIMNESLIQVQSEEYTKPECLENTNAELVSAIDKNSIIVDATLEAFGFENSFNDFSNFDVAPNFSNTTDTDVSNNWKYSKAYARIEDCERYKNPDNFVNPLLTSLETLDNLNTVPVYTTKDGKITYSPNPKFTYRALIMEAREREGYPTLRESCSGNPRAPESSHYSKNQASFRKRKNSDAYSYAGSHNKKNYFQYYEPRQHGESSIKKSPDPWNRSYFNHNKYNRQSRDRNSHNFTSLNSDAEKKHNTKNTAQERVSTKYKHREKSTGFDEHNKRKNGTADSFKCNNKSQYKQSTVQSASDSAWSESKRNLKYDQNSSDAAPPRSVASEVTNNKNNQNLERTICSEKYTNNSKNSNRSKDFQQMENFTSTSAENKHATKSCTNILSTKAELNLSSDTSAMKKELADLRFESSSPKTENEPSNQNQNQNFSEILNHETDEGLTMKSRVLSSEWEDSCESLTVQQSSFSEINTPAEPLLDEINYICDDKTKVNELYDEVDEIYLKRTTNSDEKKSDDINLSENKCITPSNSSESPIDCNQKRLKTDRNESITNEENKNTSYAIPIDSIPTDKCPDEQEIPQIPETPNKLDTAASLNKEAENTQGEDKFDETLHGTDSQKSLNCAENCTLEVRDINQEDVVDNEVHMDTRNKFASPNQIGELQDNVETPKFTDRIELHTSEDLCRIQETEDIERKEPKIKSYKIKPENKNETSVRNVQQGSNASLSLKLISEYENTSKPQSQFENYIAYSPSNESPEDTKAIPKLVIRKTDSLNSKNACLSPSSPPLHGAFAEIVSDREEHSAKVSVQPKIPKILIRNAKSRPSTPSIEEITEKKTFSVTTKEESKVPKVKIRFDDKRVKSPTVSSNQNVAKTDATENKIPKMKIKLEDRLPKIIMENINTDTSGSNEEVPKTIPKMKIKKFKGAHRQVVETQILPVSIPRMFIYTEVESEKEKTLEIHAKKEIGASDKNLKPATPNSIQEDQKIVRDAELKKIPKLKIKRQSSGCSIELNRKRHSISPIQSELKKVKKSSKLAEPNDKRQLNKLSVGSEYHDSLNTLDTFNIEQSYELTSSENVEYTAVVQSSESFRGEQTKSTGCNNAGTPEEIPKVIIKRTSPSAEFKCELSKVRRDAIIKNKRWQPEVKLQRSWVLDCMAKDLNLDKLRLKLATPGSILKKCLPHKESELRGTHVENGNVNTNQSEKKLFRSKSTSELIPTHGTFGILATNDIKQLDKMDATDLPRDSITPKRCKSDLGSTFSKYSENFECKKKLKQKNHSNTIQLMLKSAPNFANDLANSLSIQSTEEADVVVGKYLGEVMKDLKTNFNSIEIRSNNDGTHFMEISERSQDETLVANEISAQKISSSPMNNETSDRSPVDLELNEKMLPGSTNTKYSSESICDRSENKNEITEIFVDDSKLDETHEVNDSQSHYSATKCRDRLKVSTDNSAMQNTNVDSMKGHTRSGKKHTKELINQSAKKEKIVEFDNNGQSSIENMSANYIDREKARKISSTEVASCDIIDQAETFSDNTKVSAKSSILEAPISITSDINILQKDSEICSSETSNTVDNFENISCKNNIQKLDVNDNSDDNVREAVDNNAVSENSMSHINIVEQKNSSTLNGNVLITSVINNSKSTDLDAKDIQDSEIYINLNNNLDNAMASNGNSMRNVEHSEDSQRIIEILSASPNHTQSEVEIQLRSDTIEETDVRLYHEDAIPTQFELELEIIDNVVPDPLEVPIPDNDHHTEELRNYSGDEINEDSHQSNRILDNSGDNVSLNDSKSVAMLPEKNDSQVCSINTYQREVFAYPDKRGAILSMDIDERSSTSNGRIKTDTEFDLKVEKPFSCSDLLVKEVLAAKEKLRKCLAKSRNESKFKIKARPKTAAEKKQGSSFDLNTLATSEDSRAKLENHSVINFIVEAKSSKHMDQNFGTTSKIDKLFQNQAKTDFKVNKIKSERKHSKGSKNNLIQKKYSSLPTSIQKYTNLMQVEGYSIPKHSSLDSKDRVEFAKGETTISLKNSRHLIKNHSDADARKKMPEFINSKDSKSKSSRHDGNSKYVGKSRSALPNTVVRESNLDSGQSEEKTVSDAAKHKYKSLKTSLDQNGHSMTDKATFKLYKIPKITKLTHSEGEKPTEELRESQSKEARMPILEPQVDLNGSLELSELSSDGETSRSPPVITNQVSIADYEIATRSLEGQVSLNKEKEVSFSQTTTCLEKEVPEAMPSYGKEITVADIVNDMAYHEKATIRHRRYCTLCERWFPTVARYRRHLSGYQHRHTELTQRRTIHALFTLFTGRPCPRLQPPSVVRIDCEPGELTPLQIAVQGVTKESNKVDGNNKKPTRDDK